MADIISFSKARKARARADKEQLAAENRIKFGRTKAEKDLEAAKKSLSEKRLDDLKREE